MRDLITKEEIKQVFAKKIKPKIAGLEAERSAMIKRLWKTCGGTFVILALVSLSLFHNYLDYAIPASGIILFLIYTVITSTFIAKFKSEVIKEVFTALIPGCSYQPEKSIRENSFKDSRLLNSNYDNFEGEDLVKGRLGDLGIEFSEIHVTRNVKTKNGTSKSTVYQGLFFAFTLPKDLRQNTLILADSAEKTFGRGVGRLIQKTTARTGYELVQVESVEFEKYYVVYSSDQMTSRVLLKPMVLKI